MDEQLIGKTHSLFGFDASFEAVTAMTTLEFVSDIEVAVKEMSPCVKLKPGEFTSRRGMRGYLPSAGRSI